MKDSLWCIVCEKQKVGARKFLSSFLKFLQIFVYSFANTCILKNYVYKHSFYIKYGKKHKSSLDFYFILNIHAHFAF